MFIRRVILLASLVLISSCSLAEDVTPPPSFTPTVESSVASPAPETPTPTNNPPRSSTPESEPTKTDELPANDDQVSKPPLNGNVSGNIITESGVSLPLNQKATLVGFDPDASGNYQMVINMESSAAKGGVVEFKNIEMPLNRAFILMVNYDGVEYNSEPVFITQETDDISIPVTIFGKTYDQTLLSFNQVHLFFEDISEDSAQVTELFIVTNSGKQVVVVPSDGSNFPFINFPENTRDIQYQLSQGSAQLLKTNEGFGLIPGPNKQYAFIVNYALPYERKLKFDQLFSAPVSSMTVFVPDGVKIKGEQVKDSGIQEVQGKSFQMYQVNKLATGSSLSFVLSGKPGGSSSFSPNRQTLIIVGIGLVGLLLIGLGVFLFLRDRSKQMREDESPSDQTDVDGLGDNRENIMDAMLALDDQFTAGDISKEVYEKRRLELKERLKKLL